MQSKLKMLVPTIGVFFTRLPLKKAFLTTEPQRAISQRRFVAPSFNGIPSLYSYSHRHPSRPRIRTTPRSHRRCFSTHKVKVNHLRRRRNTLSRRFCPVTLQSCNTTRHRTPLTGSAHWNRDRSRIPRSRRSRIHPSINRTTQRRSQEFAFPATKGESGSYRRGVQFLVPIQWGEKST